MIVATMLKPMWSSSLLPKSRNTWSWQPATTYISRVTLEAEGMATPGHHSHATGPSRRDAGQGARRVECFGREAWGKLTSTLGVTCGCNGELQLPSNTSALHKLETEGFALVQ